MRFLQSSLLLATLLLAACGKSPAPTSAPAPASSSPRIVSIVPAATLNLVLIGGTDRLVGVSTYDRLYLPENLQNLPVVGDYEQINYEQLVKLKPSLMIIQQEESRQPARLKTFIHDHNIQLVNIKFDHVDDIWASVLLLGKISGREVQARQAIDNAQRELHDLAVDYQDAPRPKVLYVMDPAANLVCGNNTFVEEMISLAGGDNVKVGVNFPTISRETMVKLAPDCLLIGAPDAIPEQPDDPRLTPWLSLPVPATRNHRLFLVTDGNSQMPSVNIGKNVRALAELIHRNATPQPAPAPLPPASTPLSPAPQSAPATTTPAAGGAM